MKKASSNDNHQEGQEQSRKLYRYINDTAKRLDDAHGCAQNVADLFTPQLKIQRSRLKDYCERLMFRESTLNGRKMEDMLWRKAYYEVIVAAKRLKRKEYIHSEVNSIQSHINAGIGYYHHFLSKIQCEYDLKLGDCIDFAMCKETLRKNGGDNIKMSSSSSSSLLASNSKEEQMKLAEDSVYRALIYLGDLNRYKLDIYPNWESGLALRYYNSALNYKPQNGAAHNQMATLAKSQNRTLDSVYHYMCSMACENVFECAEKNLIITFENNAKNASEFFNKEISATTNGITITANTVTTPATTTNCGTPGGQQQNILEPPDRIKRLIVRFLLLIETWYFNTKKDGGNIIYKLCHQVNVDLQECLMYTKPSVPSESEDVVQNDLDSVDTDSVTSPSYLKDDLIFKISVICLLCNAKVQKHSMVPQQHLPMITAFTLTIYSQLLQKAIDHIRDAILTLAASASNFSSPLTVQNEQQKKSKINKVRRRRKKNFSSEDESDGNLEEEEEEDDEDPMDDSNSDVIIMDGSEDEEVFSMSSSEDGDDSNDDDEDDDEEDSVNKTTDSSSQEKEKNHLNKEDLLKSSAKELPEEITPIKVKQIDQNALLKIVANEKLLQSIKVLSDWFGSEIEIVRSCGKTTRSLLRQIVQLLNLINVDIDKLNEVDKTYVDKFKEGSVAGRVPLSEDLVLNGIEVVCNRRSFYDRSLDFAKAAFAKEEALSRIDNLVKFGHELAKIDETGVSFDASQRAFQIQMNNLEEINTFENGTDQTLIMDAENEVNSIENKDLTENSRHNKMKHMGQLWLAAEVRALESRVRSKTSLSPYLVVDVDCLILHTSVVRSLVQSKKCIVVVPLTVISALDDLKKEKQEARDSIRWLELQFHHGNRFCRAQRPQECTPLPLIKYPKKKDKRMFMYIQIIECCHFLTLQQKNSPNLVTLLLGNNSVLSNGENRDISFVGMANSVGINLEVVTDFYDKWRKSYSGSIKK